MAKYSYKGRHSQTGKTVNGELEATSPQAAASQLIAKGIIPTDVKEAAAMSNNSSLDEFLNRTIFKVPVNSMMLFCRQMHSLTKAGVPIVKAISRLAETTKSKPLAKALQEIVNGLLGGQRLAELLARHPGIFSNLFVSLVDAGESSGQLELAFKQLGNYLELEAKTKAQVKTATRYPMFVIISMVVAVVIINIMVIPTFAKLFQNFKTELPLPTRILIGSSNFMTQHWGYLLMGVIVIVFGWVFYTSTPAGRYVWHRAQIRIPIIGKLLKTIILARFCRTFAMMLQSGIPLQRSINLTSASVGNVFIEAKIKNMQKHVERGDTIFQAAQQTKLFTPLVLQMLAVGEESGNIEEMLIETATYYEDEVEYDLRNLSDLIQPILLAGLGAVVLLLALGVMLPLWDMLQLIQK